MTKIRSDIEELRHDMNSHQMELHILEGKITTQENSLAQLKSHSVEQQQIRLDQVIADITHIEKIAARQSKKFEEILLDIQKLSMHANETTHALTQYKDKIAQAERAISNQNKRLEEISLLKQSLKELAHLALSTSDDLYTVKSGDTLEKIARYFNTSTHDIKTKNRLKDDRIFIGQELVIPKPAR